VLSVDEVKELASRARAGDTASFSKLVRAHYRACYCTALAVVRLPEDARDVAQDALVAAYRKIGSCQEPARFSGWLLTIVRHQAIEHLRTRASARRLRERAAVDVPAPAAPDGLLRDRLLAAAEGLTGRQAEVLFLHDLEGCTHPEIAGLLGISEVLSRQVLFEARKKMRQRLADGPAANHDDDEVPGGGP